AGESWVADVAPPERRGALVSFYHVAAKIGLIIGPFAVAGSVAGGPGGVMIAAAAFALCLVPVAVTRSAPPATPQDAAVEPRVLLQAAPAALIASLAVGAANGATLSLAPIYASRLDPADPGAAAASLWGAMLLGGLLAQYPAGMLSDRIDRRTVILLLAVLAAAMGAALAILPPAAPHGVAVLLAGLWGAGAMSIHGVAAAHAADRAAPGAIAGMLGGVLVTFSFGNMIGPLVAGAVMETPLGAPGMWVFGAVVYGLLALAVLRRRAKVDPPADDEKEAFAPIQATSLAGIEIDPRANDDEAAPVDPAFAAGPPLRADDEPS
ncbi:MAG: MFS transporter, partial [Caulobacterales bacterium]|nr:MFS transporter [Caulobacterales bacterium]